MSPAQRVFLRPPERGDRQEFTSLMRASRSFHSPWATAPTDDERFAAYLADARRADFEAMLLCRAQDGAIIGFFNLSQIVRRGFQNAYLGYAVGKPYAGQGYMRDGLELVLRYAFMNLRLHRVEANIQPSNSRSLVARPGRGLSPRGLLAALPEDRRPLARPRALGDPGRRLAWAHRCRRVVVYAAALEASVPALAWASIIVVARIP